MIGEFNDDKQMLGQTTKDVMLYSLSLSVVLILWQITHAFAAFFTILSWIVIAIPIICAITMFITSRRVEKDPDYYSKISKHI